MDQRDGRDIMTGICSKKTIKVVIWGTGNIAGQFIRRLDLDTYEILFFVDNNNGNQGKRFGRWDIEKPEILSYGNVSFDMLILCMGGWRQVYSQAVYELGVPVGKIENAFLFHKIRLLQFYEQHKSRLDDEMRNILCYLKTNPLDVFNYELVDRYTEDDFDVFYDDTNGLYYILFQGKRMYMSRKFKQEYQVRMYCNQLFVEQDRCSPHCYFDDGFQVERGSVVLDAGVAEGNFALSVIEKAEKVILVEPDKDWMEALKYTFLPFDNKVVYINRFLSDTVDNQHITIDELMKTERIDFVKMDIEGAEIMALNGARESMADKQYRLEVCSYHKPDDREKIEMVMKQYGYYISCTKGYMVNIHGDNMEDPTPRVFVRGIVRGYKPCVDMEA